MKKKLTQRAITMILAVMMVFTMGISIPETAVTAHAADTGVRWNMYNNSVVTWKPGDRFKKYSDSLLIVGTTKKSDIKNLKSSNKAIKATAANGYIKLTFGDKTSTTKISCTVKGVKLSCTYKVKKYTNPLSTFKIGSKNYTKKFAKNDSFSDASKAKNKKLNLKARSGWVIQSVSVYNGGSSKRYEVNKRTFSQKISLTNKYAYMFVHCYNSKTKVYESIYLAR